MESSQCQLGVCSNAKHPPECLPSNVKKTRFLHLAWFYLFSSLGNFLDVVCGQVWQHFPGSPLKMPCWFPSMPVLGSVVRQDCRMC